MIEQLKDSTDEVWTGKYWIDGKKIYECCKYIYQNNAVVQGVTAESGSLFSGNVLPTNINEIIDYHCVSKRSDGYVDNFTGSGLITYHFVPNLTMNKVYFNAGYTPVYAIVEYYYTKTTN